MREQNIFLLPLLEDRRGPPLWVGKIKLAPVDW
jgi:hypothetical protein